MPLKTHSIEEFRYRLAETLRTERINHGYETVYDLSEAMNIPVRTLMNMETGNVSGFGELFRLARFYGKRVKIEFE
ncbi:MAG: hypothetical protein J6L82_00240 [Alphaproteobacteria bacterium]|nr:hypothetical protein [Alphaproteobacteria bacterium]